MLYIRSLVPLILIASAVGQTGQDTQSCRPFHEIYGMVTSCSLLCVHKTNIIPAGVLIVFGLGWDYTHWTWIWIIPAKGKSHIFINLSSRTTFSWWDLPLWKYVGRCIRGCCFVGFWPTIYIYTYSTIHQTFHLTLTLYHPLPLHHPSHFCKGCARWDSWFILDGILWCEPQLCGLRSQREDFQPERSWAARMWTAILPSPVCSGAKDR